VIFELALAGAVLALAIWELIRVSRELEEDRRREREDGEDNST